MPRFDACGPRARAAITAAAFFVSLWGLGWGLPSAERLEPLLPEALRADSGFRFKLAESWKQLYKDLEANRLKPFDYLTEPETLPGGWTLPPPRLMNSFRSFFLRSENADEQKVLSYLSSMRPRELNFRPFGIGYGGAFLYPLGAWYMALKLVGLVVVSADPLPYLVDPAVMARVWIVGRLFNAFFCALCAGAVAWLGGWFAGVLFLVLPAFAVTSHYLNPYGFGCLLALVGLGFCFRHLDEGRPRDLVWAGVAFGLSIGATLSYAFFGLALPIAGLLRVRDGASVKDQAKASILGGLAAAAAFVVTNPYLVFQFDSYRDEWAYFGTLPFVFTFGKFGRFVTELLRHNMGAAGTFVMLAALIPACARKSPPKLALCSAIFMIGWIQLSMKLTDPTHGRHFLPYLAAGAIAVGLALERLRWRSAAAAAVIGALVVGECALLSWGYLYRMHLETAGASTRLEAGRWINENIPAGSTIGFQGLPQPSSMPPFRWDRYTLVLYANGEKFSKSPLPQYLIAGDESRPELEVLSRYRVLKSFRSPPSWLPTEAWYLANTPFDILERR